MQLNNFVNFLNSFNIMESGIEINRILFWIAFSFNFIAFQIKFKKEKCETKTEIENESKAECESEKDVEESKGNKNNSIFKLTGKEELDISYILDCVMWGYFIFSIINKTKYNFLLLPSCLIVIYCFLAIPILNGKTYIYQSHSSIIILLITLKIIYEYNYIFINWIYTKNLNSMVFQAILIMCFFVQLYLNMYCLFMNIYSIDKALVYMLGEIKKILKKFYYYLKSKKHDKKNKNYVIKIFKYIFYIPQKIVYCVLSIIYFLMILPIVILTKKLFNIIIIVVNCDEDRLIYIFTKIILMLTFIIEFIAIQTGKIFTEPIINIYEYISTAIMIPIVLDSMQVLNKNKY